MLLCQVLPNQQQPIFGKQFHNSNTQQYGTESGLVKVGNVSTGKVVQKLWLGSALSRMGSFLNPMQLQFPKLSLSPGKALGTMSSANCMCFNEEGTMLFIGDSKGQIHVYSVDLAGFIGSELEKFQTFSQKPITCLDYRNFKMKKKEGEKEIEVKQQLLLITSQDNSVKIFQ
jgi:hypothetical protein